jgi:hypothetical protein
MDQQASASEASLKLDRQGIAALPNLFLLNPDNRAFLEGKSSWMKLPRGVSWTGTLSPFQLIVLLIVIPMAMIYYYDKDFDADIPLIPLTLLLTCIAAMILARAQYRIYYLSKHGQVLQGTFVQYDISEEQKKVNHQGVDVMEYGQYWVSKLHYQFVNPSGQTIEATKRMSSGSVPTWTRADWGKPVAVLYVNDKRYDML